MIGYDRLQEDYDRSSRGTVDYRGWLIRLVCWDGILPADVLAAPQVALSLGADRSTTEFLAIAMPLLAFFIRIPMGFRHIATNHCGPILSCCQFVVFFLSAIYLVCIDALMLFSMEMNNGRLWANQGDLVALIILLSIYFLAMLFALGPGRSPAIDPAVPGTETGRPTFIDR
ncbi:MAG: hypothetical protein O3C40_23745 [Planctomycetota bacterium]|nr:hypothetical protein [Planctomycetota bacterium]